MIIPKKNLERFGERIITIIHDRTLKGKDVDNKDFKSYSTRWFAVPIMSVTKRARLILRKSGKVNYFKKNKLTWIAINGYLTLKKAIYKQTSYKGEVNLTLTGAMLNSMTVISTGVNSLQIGFANSEQAQKAKYNIARGRNFFGIKQSEIPQSILEKLWKE